MNLGCRAALAAFAILVAACTPPAPDTSSSVTATATSPESVVQALYAPYAAGGNAPAWQDSAPLSPSLRALYMQADAVSDGVFIDADPIIAAQDYQLSDLIVTADAPPTNGRASVTARFKNMGTDTAVQFDMVENDGAWQVDNIRSGGSDLRMQLTNAAQH